MFEDSPLANIMQKRTRFSVMVFILVVVLFVFGWLLRRDGILETGGVVKVPSLAAPLGPSRPASAVVPPLAPVAAVGVNAETRPLGAPGENSLDGSAVLRQMRGRVDNLIQNQSPLPPGEVFKRVQEPTPDHGAIQIRSDAVVVALEENEESDHAGFAYYFPAERLFYIQWDATKDGIFPANKHYYGPFEGDPYTELGLPRPAGPTKATPATAGNSGG
jgi:hypothetical protein